MTALGLLLARRVGLETPIFDRWLYSRKTPLAQRAWRVALLIGAALGGIIVLLFYIVFLPRIPQWPVAAEAMVPIWMRLLACFYGAINEEVLMRLFLLSLVLWLLKKILREKALRPPSATFWIANVIVALLFGAGHLSAARALMQVTPIVVTAIMSSNGIASLVFGYLSWKRGIEAAMLAHFSADLVMHIVGPMFIRT